MCLQDALEGMSMAKSLALKNGYEQDASQDIKGEYAGGCLCCLVRSQYCAQACRPHCARTVSHSVLPTLSHSGPALPLARAHTRFAQRKRSHRRPCNISHPVPPWPHPPAALGLANIAGSACCCYNATGSFSRSAVNNDVVSIPPNYPTSTTTPRPTHPHQTAKGRKTFLRNSLDFLGFKRY